MKDLKQIVIGSVIVLMFVMMALSGLYEGEYCRDLTPVEAAEAGCYQD